MSPFYKDTFWKSNIKFCFHSLPSFTILDFLALVERCPCSWESQLLGFLFFWNLQTKSFQSRGFHPTACDYLYIKCVSIWRVALDLSRQHRHRISLERKMALAAVPGSLFWRDLFLKCFPAVISFLTNLSLIQCVAPFSFPFFAEGKLLAYGCLPSSIRSAGFGWDFYGIVNQWPCWDRGDVFHVPWAFNYMAWWQSVHYFQNAGGKNVDSRSRADAGQIQLITVFLLGGRGKAERAKNLHGLQLENPPNNETWRWKQFHPHIS